MLIEELSMKNAPDTRRLSWLKASLNNTRDDLLFMVRALSILGTPGAMKPSLYRRFLVTVDQIIEAKEIEKKLFTQIETIENRHKIARRQKRLHEIKADNQNTKAIEIAPMNVAKRPELSIWWLLALWYLLSGQKFQHK